MGSPPYQPSPPLTSPGRGWTLTRTSCPHLATMADQTVPLAEAAKLLGTTVEALRKRCQRRQMEAFRGNDRRWMVTLDMSTSQQDKSEFVQDNGQDNVLDKLVSILLDQVQTERGEKARLFDQLRSEHDEKTKLLDLVRGLAGRLEEAGRLAATVDRLALERDQAREQLAELKSLVGQLVGKLDTTAAEDIRREVAELRNSTGKALIGLQRAIREA